MGMEDICKPYRDISISLDESDIERKFPFLNYAIKSWVLHAASAEKEGIRQEDLLSFFLPPSDLLLLWIRIYQQVGRYKFDCPASKTTLLHIASRYNLTSTAKTILKVKDVEADS